MFYANNIKKFIENHPRISEMEKNIILNQMGDVDGAEKFDDYQAYVFLGGYLGELFLREYVDRGGV